MVAPLGRSLTRAEAADTFRGWVRLAQSLAGKFRGGRHVDPTTDLARSLLLPGTFNRKLKANPRLVTLIGADGLRFNPSDFELCRVGEGHRPSPPLCGLPWLVRSRTHGRATEVALWEGRIRRFGLDAPLMTGGADAAERFEAYHSYDKLVVDDAEGGGLCLAIYADGFRSWIARAERKSEKGSDVVRMLRRLGFVSKRFSARQGTETVHRAVLAGARARICAGRHGGMMSCYYNDIDPVSLCWLHSFFT